MLVYKYLSSTLNEDAIDVQLASSDVGDSFNKKQYKNRKGEFIDIDTVLDIIKFAVQDMNDNFPGSIGKILRRKPIILTSDPRIKRMATDGCNIFVNPHWIIYLMNVDGIGEDYIVEAVAFVLAHEALHIIFRHVYDEHSTDQYADHNRANVSQDCQINLYIKYALGAVYKPFKEIYEPLRAIIDDDYRGDWWTEIYDKMPNDHPNLQPEKPKPTSLAFKKGFSDGYAYGIQVLRKNKLIENCNV
jgi:hypothetical protein